MASFAPSAPLREHVQGYLYRNVMIAELVVWPVSAEANPALVLTLGDPHEAFEYSTGVVRSLPEAMLVGPQSRRPADIRATGRHQVLIVSFQPAGLNRLFGLEGSELANTATDATLWMGPEVRQLMQRLREAYALTADPSELVRCVEHFLHDRLSESGRAGPIHRAAMALHRSNGLTELCHLVRESGHSVRHFNRAFLRQIGMTPKRYARVARFGYAMRLKLDRPRVTWADISQQAGYYDQNHMIKEFKSLVGEGPSAFLKAMNAAPRAIPDFSLDSGLMSKSY